MNYNEKLEELQQQKTEIEHKIEELKQVLEANPNDEVAKQDFISINKKLNEIFDDIKDYTLINKNKGLMDMFEKYDRGEIEAEEITDPDEFVKNAMKERMKRHFKDKPIDSNYEFKEQTLDEINESYRISNETPNTEGLLTDEGIDKIVDVIEKKHDS